MYHHLNFPLAVSQNCRYPFFISRSTKKYDRDETKVERESGETRIQTRTFCSWWKIEQSCLVSSEHKFKLFLFFLICTEYFQFFIRKILNYQELHVFGFKNRIMIIIVKNEVIQWGKHFITLLHKGNCPPPVFILFVHYWIKCPTIFTYSRLWCCLKDQNAWNLWVNADKLL